MIGLALAGGGVKGSYQIGSFMAFKKCHIKIDGITGTSIGAFNGAMIAAHKEKELLTFWQNADVASMLGINKNLIDKVHNEEPSLKLLDMSFKELYKIVKNAGISIDSLQEFLKTYNLEESLRKSNVDFGLSTYRLKDHKPLDIFISDMRLGSLDNYIMSSCYLPIFKREKLEGDSYYFDGGIYNYSPYNMLLKKGYDKVYSIELNAIGIKQIPIDKEKVIVISPSRKLTRMIAFDQKAIKNNINIGYYDTLKVLKGYDGYKYIFKNKSDNYFQKLNKNIPKDKIHMLKGFLSAKNDKEIVIKALEYLMKKENMTYFNVYDIKRTIKLLRKKENDSLVHKYICQLNI